MIAASDYPLQIWSEISYCAGHKIRTAKKSFKLGVKRQNWTLAVQSTIYFASTGSCGSAISSRGVCFARSKAALLMRICHRFSFHVNSDPRQTTTEPFWKEGIKTPTLLKASEQ